MDARSIASRELPLPRLTIAAALAICCLLVSLSALLLARRISGGFAATLSTPPFLAMSGLLLAAIALPRLAGVWLAPAGERPWLRLALLGLPSVAALAILATLSSGALSPWPLTWGWLAVAMEEGIWWTVFFRPRRTPPRETSPSPLSPAIAAVEREHVLPASDDEPLADHVVQQLTRVRNADGTESLFGVLRGDLAPGERNLNLHVAFCPPLAEVPELSFEQVDGPPATIKAAQVETFGARLEVRLDGVPREAARILVEFSTCPIAQSSAF